MKKILVCTDGSHYGNICCEYGGWLASRLQKKVEVLYVTDLRQFEVPLIADLSGSLGIQPYQAILSQLQELEVEKAKVILESAETSVRKHFPDADLTRTHKTGFLVDSLGDLEKDAAFILLGKRGERSGFATDHLGSTVERVVRASSRPCLVTSRSFREPKKMLLAYDGGKSGQKAADFLATNDGFKDLELHIIIVAEESGQEDEALQHLHQAEERLKKAGYNTVCQMLHGIPEEAIARYVAVQEMNLLIMGAYGHSRIRRLFIGSTTTEMLRRCLVPVMLFR
ncbi:MAG TPA: universal stress protein [Opitutales bacterium]|nr:universal stress protein [Opitutales bacterium]